MRQAHFVSPFSRCWPNLSTESIKPSLSWAATSQLSSAKSPHESVVTAQHGGRSGCWGAQGCWGASGMLGSIGDARDPAVFSVPLPQDGTAHLRISRSAAPKLRSATTAALKSKAGIYWDRSVFYDTKFSAFSGSVLAWAVLAGYI